MERICEVPIADFDDEFSQRWSSIFSGSCGWVATSGDETFRIRNEEIQQKLRWTRGFLAWFSQENDDSANRSQYGIFPLNKLRYFWYGQQDWELAPKAWNISEPRWVWLSKVSMPPKCIYPTTELLNWCHLISSPTTVWYLLLVLLPQSFLSGEQMLSTEFQNLIESSWEWCLRGILCPENGRLDAESRLLSGEDRSEPWGWSTKSQKSRGMFPNPSPLVS